LKGALPIPIDEIGQKRWLSASEINGYNTRNAEQLFLLLGVATAGG
jgi:hypothetical protein